jgi:ribonuclease HI
MGVRHELWEYIQALPDSDRDWLFAKLSGWSSFRDFLVSRQQDADLVGELTVVFDGGSRGNPGAGYGSYALQFGTDPPQVVHLEFRETMTNNEAEYEALIRALEDVIERLTARSADPSQHGIAVQGDSRLVINQVTGAWKAKDPRMLHRRNLVRELLQRFGQVSFKERLREEIVEVLGH